MKKEETVITLGDLREHLNPFPDNTRVFFGCPDEANPLEFVGVEDDGRDGIRITFRLHIYGGRS